MKEERPWGWYEVIDQGDRYKVKNIEVKPDSSLSLQQQPNALNDAYVFAMINSNLVLLQYTLLYVKNLH